MDRVVRATEVRGGNDSRRLRRIALHLARLLMFVAIIALMHLQYAELRARQQGQASPPLDLPVVRKFFPPAHSISDESAGRREILDAAGRSLGYVLQTSPDSDHLIGFSGPTNVLIALGPHDRIVGLHILSSGDTREHVAQVVADETFLSSFHGLPRDKAADRTELDAVSGATLTSLAIQEAVIHRLSGGRRSLRFPQPLTVEEARAIFASAHEVEQDETLQSLWYVKSVQGAEIGSILRTTPAADNIIGFQGPTEARIGFDATGRVVGIAIGNSYDNEPYVTYVREDDYFKSLFHGMALPELAHFDLTASEVEGVSGATMTSMAIADGLIAAAEDHRQALAEAQRAAAPRWNWMVRDLGTAAVIIAGVGIALTSLRGHRRLRLVFQLILIVYLGLINGDLLSQAMFVGWAQAGVPWSKAGGLVLLTLAALAVPLTTGRNVYCTHLCPHGAAQQLLKNRLPWRLRLPSWLLRLAKLIPGALLLWCLLVALMALPFSLVDIEPFDAWVFGVAGWATISIAVVGLAASLFVPMAYCRFGCPTGALLNFLRFHARSDRWSRRDWVATALVMLSVGLFIIH